MGRRSVSSVGVSLVSMVSAVSQRSYPGYGIATFVVLVVFVGLPVLLYVVDPGPAGEVTEASEVVDSHPSFTFTAPAGWGQTSDGTGAIVLEKGGGQIELQYVAWTGTPAELYAQVKDQLGAIATVTSMSDPTPTTVNGSVEVVPAFRRGDVNADGVVNALADAIYLLAFGFQGGPPPPCLDSVDVDNVRRMR